MSICRYAVVNSVTGIVENISLWDGVSSWESEAGTYIVKSDDAQIGFKHDGEAFSKPAHEAEPEKTEEELRLQNAVTRDVLLSRAMVAIAPLQYAKDLGVQSDDESQLLLKWMSYMVGVNRVDLSYANPDWPESPA